MKFIDTTGLACSTIARLVKTDIADKELRKELRIILDELIKQKLNEQMSRIEKLEQISKDFTTVKQLLNIPSSRHLLRG